MATKITLKEILEKQERGDKFVFVEALPPKYYEDAHLPGAINIPHDQVDQLASELLPDKSADIIVYCANGPCPNSGIAANRLQTLGYSNVKDYHLGKQEWIEAGFPVESGVKSF